MCPPGLRIRLLGDLTDGSHGHDLPEMDVRLVDNRVADPNKLLHIRIEGLQAFAQPIHEIHWM